MLLQDRLPGYSTQDGGAHKPAGQAGKDNRSKVGSRSRCAAEQGPLASLSPLSPRPSRLLPRPACRSTACHPGRSRAARAMFHSLDCRSGCGRRTAPVSRGAQQVGGHGSGWASGCWGRVRAGGPPGSSAAALQLPGCCCLALSGDLQFRSSGTAGRAPSRAADGSGSCIRRRAPAGSRAGTWAQIDDAEALPAAPAR